MHRSSQNIYLKTQKDKRMTIQNHFDAKKFGDTFKQPCRKSEIPLKGRMSDELERENEVVDLSGIDVQKKYTSPTKLQKALEPVQKMANIPENPFSIDKEVKQESSPAEINDVDITEEYKKVFSVYNLTYDFQTKQFIDVVKIPQQFLEVPKQRDIYKFCKKVVVFSKMEKEIPILALIYIEKLMMKTGLLMNEINWRRFTFIALVIASKVL